MSLMATRVADPAQFDFEAHRRGLTGYCYRMLGSGSEAEDAVQETMVRAWRKADTVESPEALKSWLYRIATNVCLDMLGAAQRRARPVDLAAPSAADAALDAGLAEENWVLPIQSSSVLPDDGDPAELAEHRETLRLAFVAALQHLPPKQRAVLILREVLRWQATEVAELLDTSVASVNSALQRARATLDSTDVAHDAPREPLDDEHSELLARYVDAFERYDVAGLVTLIHEDATFTMPPFQLWVKGREQIQRFMLGPGIGCQDNRIRTSSANGSPVVAIYKRTPGDSAWRPWNLSVLDISGGRITAVQNFVAAFAVKLFDDFGLPPEIRE